VDSVIAECGFGIEREADNKERLLILLNTLANPKSKIRN
jgi:hypothetical protein